MTNLLSILGFLVLLSIQSFAQNSIIDKYIHQGLESNLALQQQNFSLQQSLQALREAKGQFLPALQISSRYSRAEGGREIEFPVGSIVNPIYQSINTILQNMNQEPLPFSPLEDQTIPFLRKKEHDTKIRLVQPIFQPAIYYNYKLKSGLNELKIAEVNVFKRQLVQDIKSAYINYLKIDQIVKTFEETQRLVQENLRVSEKLYKAEKVTKDVVYRSEAELSRVEQNKLEAENRRIFAQYYFNFLLNRTLDSTIEVMTGVPLRDKSALIYEVLQESAFNNREELKLLQSAIDVAQNTKKVSQSNYFPGISAVLDYGFQGEEYRFTSEDDYWMTSLVLNWNLFNGFQDMAKVEQAELEKRKIESQYQELKNQIDLQVRQAYDNLLLAYKKIEVSNRQLISSQASFNLVNKKYQQGMITVVEYIDARTNFTNAQINNIISTFDYYIRYAEMERITATYEMPKVAE